MYLRATEYKINFRPLVFEIQCPQNFGDVQTARQTFSKNGQIVFRTSQNMQIHRKPDVENLRESNAFFLCIQKEVKKTSEEMEFAKSFLFHLTNVKKKMVLKMYFFRLLNPDFKVDDFLWKT